MKKLRLVLPVLCVAAMLLSGCELGKNSSTPTVSADISSSEQETSSVVEASVPETTESIVESEPQNSNSVLFDDLEITVDPSITLAEISNQFSELDGSTALVVPVTIKNTGDETSSLNMFYAKYFGSKGTELDSLYFFFDDGSDLFKDIRPGASITANYYMLYDGDGTYYLTFNSFSETKEIAIEVALN